MDDLYIAGTATTPELDFKFSKNILNIKGESYPENAAVFYGPPLTLTKQYLGRPVSDAIEVNVQLAYFNSSSTKIFLSLFEALNEVAATGRKVALNWYYDEEDDTILEFGTELADDFPAILFSAVPVSTS